MTPFYPWSGMKSLWRVTHVVMLVIELEFFQGTTIFSYKFCFWMRNQANAWLSWACGLLCFYFNYSRQIRIIDRLKTCSMNLQRKMYVCILSKPLLRKPAERLWQTLIDYYYLNNANTRCTQYNVTSMLAILRVHYFAPVSLDFLTLWVLVMATTTLQHMIATW